MRESLRVFSERGENRKIINAGLYDGDFKNFLDSRSAKYKIDLLGKNRYMLLQQNKIKWDDLVNANGELRLLKKNKDGKYTGLQK